MAEEKLRLDEESLRALETLVEVAVRLKEAGILDMLRVIAEKGEELMALLGNDVGIMRMLGLAHAAHSALEHGVTADDVAGAKRVIELLTSCGLKAMASTEPSRVKPRGLFGMMGALRDRDVQVGLSLLLDIAKNLGVCVRQRTRQA
ncbi:MAG: hypothetical protein DSY37_00550 [Hyperthermus sp.]|nr:MAG: hypothetical protein DSY37_00550 [Hyperthermus sp.]